MAEQAEVLEAEDVPEELGTSSAEYSTVLKERYLIDAGSPLAHLNSPNAPAYKVTDPHDANVKVFALICDPLLPVRIDTMMKLKSAAPRGIMPLVDWGVIEWPLTGDKRIAVIYDLPNGGRLTDLVASGATRVSEYEIVNRILAPCLSGLLILGENEITHRAIRPDNMFFMDDTYQDLVLGECVTVPAGYDQPISFETIERCTAEPIGRGSGSELDDSYALGVSIMIILLGRNPVQNMSLFDILSDKIERGSYAAISAGIRVPIPAIEMLRGLLSDDINARWTPEIAEIWIDGRKNTPGQRKGQLKAKSAYTFQNFPHSNPRTLAYAFSLAPDEALRTIKADETFEKWLRRGLDDKDLGERISGLMEMASRGSGPKHSQEIVISKICIMLDPTGPIRYKNRSFHPESYGTLIAFDILNKQNPQDVLEVVTRELYEVWFKSQYSSVPSHAIWQRQYLRCKNYLKVNEMGFGPERCLYELNKHLQCLSPLIIDEFITNIGELLPAIDRAASTVEHETHPMDRHIAAFIGARFNEDIHPHLSAMALPEKERSIIGILSLLAFLQWKLKTPPVYGLSSWFGGLLGPAISTYNNRKTRRIIEKEIPQLVRKGSLPELFDLVDNTEQRQEDETGFLEARKEYNTAEVEIDEMGANDGSQDKKLLLSGQKAAAMFSIILTMIITSILFLTYKW